MATLNLSGWEAGVKRIRGRVYDGALRTAEQVHSTAVARAPVRKAFASNRKATKHDLADFATKVRGGTYTGADLEEAGRLLGLGHGPTELDISKYRRGSPLQARNTSSVVGLGPNHLSWRRTRRSRITGADLREITPSRTRTIVRDGKKVKQVSRGGTFNTARLKRQGVSLLGRARREAAKGIGVIKTNGRRQYGGYLKKHIVLIQPSGMGSRIVITVRSEAPYSRYVEFPTSRTAAQPFLLPALKGARGKYAGNIRKVRG